MIAGFRCELLQACRRLSFRGPAIVAGPHNRRRRYGGDGIARRKGSTMNEKRKEVDIRLDRDPRYAAAKKRMVELQLEAVQLERECHKVDAEIGSMAPAERGSKLTAEASAMLVGAALGREAASADMRATLGSLRHKLAVVREAVRLQTAVVENLIDDASRVICADVLPQHQANVRRVFEAALELNTALEAESDLRASLYENGIRYSGTLRPMPLLGFGTLADGQSRVSRYMAECYEFGFVAARDLPDIVRDRLPPPPAKAAPQLVPVDNDGWGG